MSYSSKESQIASHKIGKDILNTYDWEKHLYSNLFKKKKKLLQVNKKNAIQFENRQ